MIMFMRDDLPTGTVTFLSTDVEGSTKLLHELGADAYADELAQHRRVVREACGAEGGVEVDTQGDAFLVAFTRATDALAAASEAQVQLASGPLSVRMGLHTGEPLRTTEGYVGLDVHRAARIAAAAHGGQVLLSQTTRDLVEVEVSDLGLHRLKDLGEPVRLYQLGEGDFPPLRTLRNVRLPVPATPFLGRERELETVVELLTREELRLLTLTGPGGTGKTRLALQAAAEASDRYPDGICWVPLSPLGSPDLLLSAVARALELKEQPGGDLSEMLGAELAGKRMLLLLDNAEHLLPEAAEQVAQLVATSGPAMLVTSRERLQLQAEQVYPVPTLVGQDAIELFLVRARALEPAFAATDSVGELCLRLDSLPLALELAAARTTLFSPEQLLERLSHRLDLLKGGRDADPRQQTLRATIDWSYELLAPEEQQLFRSMAVFAGGCGYEAAEEVCGADPDTLQSLLDKSLLRRRDSKFGSWYWMLETIREYASERLEQSGVATELRRRQAEWCLALAERLSGTPGPGSTFGRDTEALERLARESDNIRSALRWAWAAGEDELGLRLGAACFTWWFAEPFHDAQAWLETAAERIPHVPPGVQLQALKVAGMTAFFVLADTEQADRYWGRAYAVAKQLNEADEIAWIESRRASVAWETGNLELAYELHQASLAQARAAGDRQREGAVLHLFGEVLRDLGRFDEAEHALLEAGRIAHKLGHKHGIAQNTHSLADLALDRGDLAAALSLYRRAIAERPDSARMPSLVCLCLAGIASILADRGQDEQAATLWGVACGAEEALGFRMVGAERRRYETRLTRLESVPAWSVGRNLTLDEAVELIPSTGR
jgi:predicted ATPase/class 3 adenylate cyclase